MGGKVHETLKYRWKPIAMLSKGRNAFNVKDDVLRSSPRTAQQVELRNSH